ncbi:SDR family NAD(P)-dependent oxidoreductase [Rhodococcoides fascians]|uniref:SDR family NAD(P)-dependent oxidoreductase n=1 Tax=Rhodococcoides fascians TaxID=1828 RepID=UPI00050CEE40|nr:SDR family oxidoreductase [Rhodococcus fascians]
MGSILLTGGSSGIGLSIAGALAPSEHRLVLVGRNFASLPPYLKDRTEQVAFDLRDTAAVPSLVSQVGDVDILINNAGVLPSLAYDVYDEKARREVLAVNLESPVELIGRVAHHMTARQAGRIINIASIGGAIGQTDVWYAITKAGMINLTKSFAKILGPEGIQVNCVSPGPVATEMFARIPPERRNRVLSRTVLQRPASPAEVAETVRWLALDAPEYLNGACVDMYNGATLR